MYDLGAPLHFINSSAGCALCDVTSLHSTTCETSTPCIGDGGTSSCGCVPGDNRHECERGIASRECVLDMLIHEKMNIEELCQILSPNKAYSLSG